VKRFRGGLVFKDHRPLYQPTLGLRAIKRRRRRAPPLLQRGISEPPKFPAIDFSSFFFIPLKPRAESICGRLTRFRRGSARPLSRVRGSGVLLQGCLAHKKTGGSPLQGYLAHKKTGGSPSSRKSAAPATARYLRITQISICGRESERARVRE